MPNRYLNTVASHECETGCLRMLESARAQGWDGPLRVYTSDDSWNPDLSPYGADLVRRPRWWKDSAEVMKCANAEELLKIDALTDSSMEDGSIAVYVDGSDVAWLENPVKLFDWFDAQGAVVMAGAPYMTGAAHHHNQLVNAIVGPKLQEPGPYCNGGVVIGRVGPELRMAASAWKYLTCYAMFCGPWHVVQGKQRQILGDQRTFNVVWKQLWLDKKAAELPLSWNYRGGTLVRNCRISGEGVRDPNGLPVYLAHSSGNKDIPELLYHYSCKRGIPSYSVLMPARNAAKFIHSAVRSICGQDFMGDKELLIGIDGCKETLDAVNKIRQPWMRVFWFDTSPGCYVIRNTLAVRAAKSHLLFFDSDDIMLPNLMSRHALAAVKNPEPLLVKSRSMLHFTSATQKPRLFRPGCAFSLPADRFKAVGGFEPWVCAADKELVQRAVAAGAVKLHSIDEALFIQTKHGGNLTVKADTKKGSELRTKYRAIIDRRKTDSVLLIPYTTAPCEEV